LSFFPFFNTYKLILLVSGLGSFLLGTLAAIPQSSIRRFIAYSSTGQVGFILLGLSTGTQSGCIATLTFLFIYILNNLIFLGVLLTAKNPKNGKYLNSFNDLTFFCKLNPSAAWALVLSLFSFAGLPPLPGFFSKFLILRALIDSYLFFPCIFALLFSCVSAFYYIRFIKNLLFYFYTPKFKGKKQLYYEFNSYFFKQSKFNLIISITCLILVTFPFFLTNWYYFLSVCVLKSDFFLN
jgi:NADH:ubiquinone oxidoreductase subunit 2 (subunit N)